GFADDLPQVLAALDLVLYVPLESDGMSRVVFECLGAGRPLIASRVGVVPEVLTDGASALLVPAGDTAALADAVARLLGNPAERDRLGRAGRKLVENRYSGACLAAALEARYARFVAAAGACRSRSSPSISPTTRRAAPICSRASSRPAGYSRVSASISVRRSG